MNWFKFSKYICNDKDKLNRNFFQNYNKVDNLHNDHHPAKSIAWDKNYRPKCERGLDIKKMKDLSVAYLVK